LTDVGRTRGKDSRWGRALEKHSSLERVRIDYAALTALVGGVQGSIEVAG
jgi:hypothetical protein